MAMFRRSLKQNEKKIVQIKKNDKTLLKKKHKYTFNQASTVYISTNEVIFRQKRQGICITVTQYKSERYKNLQEDTRCDHME